MEVLECPSDNANNCGAGMHEPMNRPIKFAKEIRLNTNCCRGIGPLKTACRAEIIHDPTAGNSARSRKAQGLP